MKSIFVILFLGGMLMNLHVEGQSEVKVVINYYYPDSSTTRMTANCDSIVDFAFIAKTFNYPPEIGDNIVYSSVVDKNQEGIAISADVHNLFDEMGRLRTYFYRGSMVSGIIPQGYQFAYSIENPSQILLITDDADFSEYKLFYKACNNEQTLYRIEHRTADGILLDELIIL